MTGVRNVDHILTRDMLPELSAELLSRMSQGQSVSPEGSLGYETS